LVYLSLRHRRLVEEGACASADLAVDEATALEGEVVIHPDIHDVQSEVMLSAEEADTCSTPQHTIDDLTSDLTGALAHLLTLDTVVCGEDEVLAWRERGLKGILDSG